MKMTGFVPLGQVLLLEYGLRQYGYTQTIPVGSPAAAELEQTGQTRSLQQVRFVYGKNGKPYLGTGQGRTASAYV